MSGSDGDEDDDDRTSLSLSFAYSQGLGFRAYCLSQPGLTSSMAVDLFVYNRPVFEQKVAGLLQADDVIATSKPLPSKLT